MPVPEKKERFFVAFSGGIGSFLAAERLLKSVPKEQVTLLFCDTKIEDEDLYRFVDEAAAKLGCPLVRLEDGRTPWEVFRDLGFQGNSRIAPCSSLLKRTVMNKYIDAALSQEPGTVAVLALGIHYSERERLERAKANNPKYRVIAPLCEAPYLSNPEGDQILASYGLRKPRLYAFGFPHNNCGGFCVRSGIAQFRLLRETFPSRFLWHKEQQNALPFRAKQHPFLRVVEKGHLKYLTLEEFEARENSFGEQYRFDFGGCGCFIDDTESE